MLFRLLLVFVSATPFTNLVVGQDDFFRFQQGPATGQARTVDVSAKLIQLDAYTVELQVTVIPPVKYYIYSTTTPRGQKTTLILSETAGLQPAQPGFTPDHQPKTEFVDVFSGDVEKFMGAVTWSQQLVSESALTGTVRVSGTVNGQICTDGDGGEGGECVLLFPAPEFTAELVADESLRANAPSTLHRSNPDLPSRVVVTQDGIPDSQAKVRYTVSLSPAGARPGEQVTLRIQADLAEGWHTYSMSTIPDPTGWTPTKIELTGVVGLQPVDEQFRASSVPRKIDNPIGEPLQVHDDSVTWSRRFEVSDVDASISGTIEGQLCTDKKCELPKSAAFAVGLGDTTDPASSTVAGSDAGAGVGTGVDTAQAPESQERVDVATAARRDGLLFFLAAAIGAGFVSLLTPCVFPMIPVTVAFFLKQGESGHGNTKLLAVIYCLGIVGSFTVIGVLVSVIFGAQTMTELANGPWLNLLFAAVFVAFALMLMGVFELRVPTWLLNWSAQREGQGGIIGVLFMALTFTLVSFTCTAAFVAPLLVEAAKGDWLWPTLGMLAFSTAFASPFYLLAQFPGFLKQLPKSGGWMQKVKCTAGLIELALVVKFLSVADIGFSPTATPRFIDFSTAMVLWATLAFVTGMYLLGIFRFSKDTPTDGISPVGGLWAMGSIGLGLLICVGLFSPAPPDSWIWNRLVGFAPPRFESAAVAAGHETSRVKDEFAELARTPYALSHDGLAYTLQLEEALQAGRREDRPVFVDFTGVNCQNCRDMENDVLNRPDIIGILSTLPRAQLYLDRIPTVPRGEESDRLLDENRQLSQQLTGGTAMPTYVILSPDGRRVMSSTAGVVSREEFSQFLQDGIRRFEESRKDIAIRDSSADDQL